MHAWLVDMFGENFAPIATVIVAAAIVILLALVIIWIARRLLGGGFNARIKGRAPRLAVVDMAGVDQKRKLVLIRRDDVEHLVMIGGETDFLIEAGIMRIPAAPRHQGRGDAAPRVEMDERPHGGSAPARAPAPRPVAVAAPEPAARPQNPPRTFVPASFEDEIDPPMSDRPSPVAEPRRNAGERANGAAAPAARAATPQLAPQSQAPRAAPPTGAGGYPAPRGAPERMQSAPAFPGPRGPAATSQPAPVAPATVVPPRPMATPVAPAVAPQPRPAMPDLRSAGAGIRSIPSRAPTVEAERRDDMSVPRLENGQRSRATPTVSPLPPVTTSREELREHINDSQVPALGSAGNASSLAPETLEPGPDSEPRAPAVRSFASNIQNRQGPAEMPAPEMPERQEPVFASSRPARPADHGADDLDALLYQELGDAETDRDQFEPLTGQPVPPPAAETEQRAEGEATRSLTLEEEMERLLGDFSLDEKDRRR